MIARMKRDKFKSFYLLILVVDEFLLCVFLEGLGCIFYLCSGWHNFCEEWFYSHLHEMIFSVVKTGRTVLLGILHPSDKLFYHKKWWHKISRHACLNTFHWYTRKAEAKKVGLPVKKKNWKMFLSYCDSFSQHFVGWLISILLLAKTSKQ